MNMKGRVFWPQRGSAYLSQPIGAVSRIDGWNACHDQSGFLCEGKIHLHFFSFAQFHTDILRPTLHSFRFQLLSKYQISIVQTFERLFKQIQRSHLFVYLFTWILQMISSCPCFCFALGFEAIILVFGSPLCQFLFAAPLAVHGAGSGHQSVSASLLWRHSFQPSSTDHVNIATGASSQTRGSCLMRKYLWWKFHIYDDVSRVMKYFKYFRDWLLFT